MLLRFKWDIYIPTLHAWYMDNGQTKAYRTRVIRVK